MGVLYLGQWLVSKPSYEASDAHCEVNAAACHASLQQPDQCVDVLRRRPNGGDHCGSQRNGIGASSFVRWGVGVGSTGSDVR